MKFKKISDFEDKIIDKLVKKETRDYYYNMKKWESKRKANSILSEKNEQLTIF